jgi:hypothetical protein
VVAADAARTSLANEQTSGEKSGIPRFDFCRLRRTSPNAVVSLTVSVVAFRCCCCTSRPDRRLGSIRPQQEARSLTQQDDDHDDDDEEKN